MNTGKQALSLINLTERSPAGPMSEMVIFLQTMTGPALQRIQCRPKSDVESSPTSLAFSGLATGAEFGER